MSSKGNVIKRRKSNVIFDAVLFATRAHTWHCRKGSAKIPYIIHPLGAAKILIEHNLPDHVIVAGVLHDTVEDTCVTLRQIHKRFGAKVAGLVAGASEPHKSDTWEERKRHTLKHLRKAPKDLLHVVCADKLDNIRSMVQDYRKVGEKLFDRFNQPKGMQSWYYKSLSNVFMSRIKDSEAPDLFREYNREVRKLFGARKKA